MVRKALLPVSLLVSTVACASNFDLTPQANTPPTGHFANTHDLRPDFLSGALLPTTAPTGPNTLEQLVFLKGHCSELSTAFDQSRSKEIASFKNCAKTMVISQYREVDRAFT